MMMSRRHVLVGCDLNDVGKLGMVISESEVWEISQDNSQTRESQQHLFIMLPRELSIILPKNCLHGLNQLSFAVMKPATLASAEE